MSPHVATVTKLCLKFMTFDPNYNYDDNEEDEDSMDIEDGADEGLLSGFYLLFFLSRTLRFKKYQNLIFTNIN